MDERSRKELAMFLGDEDRDFEASPLTQNEIQSAIEVYSHEIKDEDLDPDIKELYSNCLEVLKKHLFFH